MRKKIVLLGICLIFILSSFLSGAFAPIISKLQASSNPSVEGHYVETDTGSIDIRNLPNGEYKVTDLISESLPTVENGYYTLSRMVGKGTLVGVSDANEYMGGGSGAVDLEAAANADKKFDFPGMYIYKFYTESQFKSTDADGNFNGKPVHDHVITVSSSVYTIALPTNSEDILPNITVPNNSKSNPRHPEYKAPNEAGHVAPIVPIVLPLPQSIFDTEGRDLLGLSGDEETRNDAIAALQEIYGTDTIASLGDTIANIAAAETDVNDEKLRDLIYADMRIAFYGNGNTEYSRDTESTYTAQQFGIKEKEWRTFVPVNDSTNYYAEYYFQHTDISRGINVSASLRTDNITVEQPNVSQTLIDNIKTEILFNAKPSMSFVLSNTGSSLKVGTEVTLPIPSMTVSADSAIIFDNIGTIASYSYINVLYHPKDNSTFKYLDKNGEPTNSTADADILKITDFKFTPKAIGTYQFVYYTTTLFHYGKNNHNPVPLTSGKYLKHYPIEDQIIERNTQTPEFKWTAPYQYKYADGAGALLGAFFGTDTTSTEFEDAEDYSKYLPSSKTVIKKGEYLYVPAVLGNSNFTDSDDLDYQLYLYRYDDYGRNDTDRIRWGSEGTTWDHTQPFMAPEETTNGICFPNKLTFETTDMLGSTTAVSGAKWAGKSVAGKYDLMIRVYDPHNSYSAQLTYTFEVVDGYTPSRPVFSSSLKFSQQEYYEKDVVKFNVVNVTDTYTDSSNIEVKYYVSVNNGADITAGDAVEIKNDVSKGMSIKNGIVSFELNAKNPAGAYVLSTLDNDESLTFRVYAVARNYHALVGGIDGEGIELDDWIGTVLSNLNQEVVGPSPDARQLTIDNACLADNHEDALPYIAASYDSVSIYKTSFGKAAQISESSNSGYTWTDYLDTQDTSQGKKIAIPMLQFGYPDTSGDNESYFSTITYEIIHQESGTVLGASSIDTDGRTVGGGWYGTIGEISVSPVILGQYDYDSNNDIKLGIESQRYFETSKVGIHWVIVKVTNSGGNVGIFVGAVFVKGIPQYSSRLISDGFNTMKIGESKSLPSVEVTINGEKYVSGGIYDTLGYIVTEKNVTTGPAAGRQAKVGTYSVTCGSENGNPTTMNRNSFAPTTQGRYVFTYTISIDDRIEGENIYLPSLSGNRTISFQITHYITVNNIESSDLILNIDTDRYKATSDAAPDINSPDFDPTETNRYNFFNEMTVDRAEGVDKLLEMTNSQLYNGIEPYMPSGFDADMSWQYGRIYLPNELPMLNSGVSGLGADFFNNADTFITVTNTTSNTVLLDTSSNSPTVNQKDTEVVPEGMYWFRPQGQLIPQYSETPTDLDEALEFAVNKDKWEPVNSDVKVDGQYVVTYTLSYKGLTITKTYNIAIGDTGQPRIEYTSTSSSSKSVFEKTYRVGDKMSFVFGVRYEDKTFNIKGTKDNDYFWEQDSNGKYYFEDTQTSGNIVISIITPTRTLKVGEDDFEINTDPNTLAETYSFRFTEAGTYNIKFRIKSKTGIWGTKDYYVTVGEKKAATQIAPEEVMGIILIVISSGLLIGIVVYFIKTGQSTKFATKRGARKQKEDKPDVV